MDWFFMVDASDSDFFTTKQAAAKLRVHLDTMYRYAKMPEHKGGPPKKKFSKKVIRFPKQKFLAWAGLTGDK